jgi:hypothetical protein
MSVEMAVGIRLSGSALRPRRFQFQIGSFRQREKEMKINTNEESYRLPAMDFASLGDYPIQFWQHLSERGYADDTIRVYLRCIGRLAEMMKPDGIAVGGLDEAQAVALVARTSWIQKRKIAATFIVRCFVRFLAERGVGKPALPRTAKETARAELRRDYETYLRRQRGLSERTIFHSWRFAAPRQCPPSGSRPCFLCAKITGRPASATPQSATASRACSP